MKNLIDQFKQERNNFVTAVNKIPVGKQETACAGDWTAKDILSHLIGWADFQNTVLKDVLEGRQPENLSNISEYNENSVKKRRTQLWNKIISELIKSTNYLISQYQKLPEDLWDKPIWKDKKTTPVKLIAIETQHYQGEHLDEIKKLFI